MKDEEKTKEQLLKELKKLHQDNLELSAEIALSSMLSSIDDLVFVLNKEGKFLNYYQKAEREDLYVPPNLFINKHFRDVLPVEISDKLHSVIDALNSSDVTQEIEYSMEIANEKRWYHALISRHINSKNEHIGVVAVVRDITKRKQEEETLNHMILHDPLTNLPNRRLLYDRFSLNMQHANRYQQKIGVCMVALDHFKKINDEFGHIIGDKALQKFSNILTNLVRKNDTVARIGGDEFVILMTELKNSEEIKLFIQKIRTAFETPCLIDNHKLQCSVSIGFSIYPADGEDIETLLKKADISMYEDKKRK